VVYRYLRAIFLDSYQVTPFILQGSFYRIMIETSWNDLRSIGDLICILLPFWRPLDDLLGPVLVLFKYSGLYDIQRLFSGRHLWCWNDFVWESCRRLIYILWDWIVRKSDLSFKRYSNSKIGLTENNISVYSFYNGLATYSCVVFVKTVIWWTVQ